MRRIAFILAATIGSTLAFPLVALADQAILVRDGYFEIGPGEVVEHRDVMIVSHGGNLPTIVYDGATGFADEETVVATIALSTHDIDGLGSVELLSSPTISGTTPADWTSGAVPPEFAFEPWIELRYTAPSADELECDLNPGESFTTYLGVSATLVGSAGTMASFAGHDFPPVVTFVITCPASDDSGMGDTVGPTVTPPPTDTLPVPDGTWSATGSDQLLFLAVVAGVGALVVLARQPTTRRIRSR